MNILYIAYSCSPYGGSEEAIGWNIPLAMSKDHNVFVVTKIEQKEAIDDYCSKNQVNIKFTYVDIKKVYKKIFKGALYSGRLNVWLKASYDIVKKICDTNDIDIIHQINPVEFRSVGEYYKFNNVKYVAGPLGGGEYIPSQLNKYLSIKDKFIEFVRLKQNQKAIRRYKKSNLFSRIDCVMFANSETENYLVNNGIDIKNSIIATEVGIKEDSIDYLQEIKNIDETVFISVGRLVYRKGHKLLLDAFSRLEPSLSYKLYIVGGGPELDSLVDYANKKGLGDKVIFCGKIPYANISEEYKKADVFVLPSLRETTGTVVMEALAHGLPIVAAKAYGAKTILDEETGYLYDIDGDKDEIVEALKRQLEVCIKDKALLMTKSKRCVELVQNNTWKTKKEFYETIYTGIMDEKS